MSLAGSFAWLALPREYIVDKHNSRLGLLFVHSDQWVVLIVVISSCAMQARGKTQTS
jgi:hypothetical protein